MRRFLDDPDVTVWQGDCLEVLAEFADGSVQAVVTSPPYMDARPDYEPFERYGRLFHEMSRVVTDAVLFNVGRIWRAGVEQLWWLAIVDAARGEGWSLLDTLVWVKPNGNPIHGQLFADCHEYVLIFGRPGTRLNEDAIRRPYAESTRARFGRGWQNHRGVKDAPTKNRQKPRQPLNELGARARSFLEIHVGREKGNPHPAPMPLELAEHLVSLASFPGATVLDPFAGSGTTAQACRKLGRNVVLIESREDYCAIAAKRLQQLSLLAEVDAA